MIERPGRGVLRTVSAAEPSFPSLRHARAGSEVALGSGHCAANCEITAAAARFSPQGPPHCEARPVLERSASHLIRVGIRHPRRRRDGFVV